MPTHFLSMTGSSQCYLFFNIDIGEFEFLSGLNHVFEYIISDIDKTSEVSTHTLFIAWDQSSVNPIRLNSKLLEVWNVLIREV